MIPNKTIEELISRHSTLEKDLSSGTVDKKLFAEKSKEYSDVNEIIENAKKYISFNNDKKELEKILNDSSSDEELKNMAEAELSVLQIQYETNEKKLKLFLLPKDEADKKNAIIEIRAGTGGSDEFFCIKRAIFHDMHLILPNACGHRLHWSWQWGT